VERSNPQQSILRILFVEDNLEREKIFRSWLPDDILPVFAVSAGQALGVIRRDRGRVYAGIALDFDLPERARTSDDKYRSGRDVMKAIMQFIHKDTAILVHSMNSSQSVSVANTLSGAGFAVDRIPMALLTRGRFHDWIDYAREIWSDRQEGE